jgi:hypothetical protein
MRYYFLNPSETSITNKLINDLNRIESFLKKTMFV